MQCTTHIQQSFSAVCLILGTSLFITLVRISVCSHRRELRSGERVVVPLQTESWRKPDWCEQFARGLADYPWTFTLITLEFFMTPALLDAEKA